MSIKPYRLGCDIGGTFTDFVLVNDETGEIHTHKCLTTSEDPSEAVQAGIEQMSEANPGFVKKMDEIIHGTTLVINTIIERKGSKTGLITTKGFRDTLEFGREIRYDLYDIFATYPDPLVSRPFRTEVNERIGYNGRVIQKLEPEEIESVLRKLVDMGIESLAVCLINSFANPVHEQMIKNVVSQKFPGLSISISYEVLPQIREYERTSTTVANAYVKPLTKRYLTRLSERLDSLGSSAKLYIMLSSGGITSAETAAEFPVRVIESGPAAGVAAAEYYGRLFNIKDMFAFDMGGTTAKSCLIQKGKVGVVSTFEVGRVRRFKKGSGLPIQVPVVDLMEIGAGGGSIARMSGMGLLQVGPDSAGANPGPACYGLGGSEPTVTDADLCLGYLDPGYFLGGAMKLNRPAAEKAIQRRIADPLGLPLVEVTFGIHDLVNETMAGAARTHIAEKGGNPHTTTVVAFGGAGPVHAYGLAKKLGAKRVLVPPLAGVGSALGFFTAPIAFEMVRTHKISTRDADFGDIERVFNSLEHEAANAIKKAGGEEDIIFERSIDMRFVGQGFEVEVPVPKRPFSDFSKDDIRAYFDDRYVALYGRKIESPLVEFVNLRVNARLKERPIHLPKIEKRVETVKDAIKGERLAFSMKTKGFTNFTVYDRYNLFPGAQFSGPAIIEERESTTVVGEDASVSVDEYGFLWISL